MADTNERPVNPKLVRKGKGVPDRLFLEQTQTYIAVFEEIPGSREALLAIWPKADLYEQLTSTGRVAEGFIIGRSRQAGASSAASDSVDEVMAVASELVHRFILAKPLVAAEAKALDIDLSIPAVTRGMHKSSSKLYAYILQLVPVVTQLEEPLRPLFRGSAPALFTDVLQRLAACNSRQEAKGQTLPTHTQRAQEAKGAAIQVMEQIRRVAKLAYSDRPEIARQFDLKIVKRGKHKRRGKGIEEASPAALISGLPDVVAPVEKVSAPVERPKA